MREINFSKIHTDKCKIITLLVHSFEAILRTLNFSCRSQGTTKGFGTKE